MAAAAPAITCAAWRRPRDVQGAGQHGAQHVRLAEGGGFMRAAQLEKHVASVFAKLGLVPSDNDNRWVIAALKYLGS